jgi:hypothetical protein
MPAESMGKRLRVASPVGLVVALLAVTACVPPDPGPRPAPRPGVLPTLPGPVVAGRGGFGPVVDWGDFVAIHMVASPDGDVLMWDRVQGYTSARRWNPHTGAFTPTPGLNVSLYCAFHTRMPDGRLAVIGGTAFQAGDTGVNAMHFFDWRTNTWSPGPSLKTPRWYPTVIALPDGRLLTLGGQIDASRLMANLAELYDPATNKWKELPGLAESRPMGLYPRAILAPNGKVFVVRNASGRSAYIDVDTQQWTEVTTAPPNVAGTGLAMYEDGKLLLYAAGSSGTDSFVIDLNEAAPSWRKVGSLQHKRRRFSTVLLPDGRVMAIGGSTNYDSIVAEAVLTPEIWNPATEQWTTLPDLGVPRMYHSNAVLLADGRVITGGGGRVGGAPNFPSGQVYSPPYLSLPDRPAISAAPKTWTEGTSVDLTVTSAHGLHSIVLMGLPGITHSTDTQQRRLTLPVTAAYEAATGRISVEAPDITNAAPGHYYAIALDARGVPSAARIVQLVAGPGTGAAASVASIPAANPDVPRAARVTEPNDEE